MSTIFNVVAEGDSLTFGFQGVFYPAFPPAIYPTIANQTSGFPWFRWRSSSAASPYTVNFANYAKPGSRLLGTGGVSDRSSTIDGLLSTSYPASVGARLSVNPDIRSTRKWVLFLMVGTNQDVSNPTTHAANVATYCLARRAAGWHGIVLATIPSRTDGVYPSFDTTYAQPYNTIIRDSSWQQTNGVTALADIAGDSRLGATNAANDTTYFNADKIHLVSAGAAIAGAIVNPAVLSALAALS